MSIWGSLVGVLVLGVLGYVAGLNSGLRLVFGSVVPYTAIAIFLVGIAGRVVRWAQSPVPFRIPTTCGQQKSLSWIKAGGIDNPSTTTGVVFRMALEILLFRSLFRNTRTKLREGPRLIFDESRFLWLGALAFHWSFLFISLRHLRFFVQPVPAFVFSMQNIDGFFKTGSPVLYLTDAVMLAAMTYLVLRRCLIREIRYISLLSDYFALFLISGLILSGVILRYFIRPGIVEVKELAMGLVTFAPVVPSSITPFFFAHLFLLSVLLAYFPFSKLAHMGGIFLSPTRNLANNNRMKRHINPWNYPVKTHSYQEWEEEFHDKIKAAGLPLEKE